MEKVLFRFAEVFTIHDDEISEVANKDAEFQIKTKGEPIYMRPRPLTPATLAAVNEEVKKLLRMGRITPADGPWSAPIVVVRKPGEKKVRLCVDYREINKVTKADRHPLPHIDSLIHGV